MARERGDRLEVGRCLNALGLVASREGDTRQAASLYREAISVFRELGEPVDHLLGNLGWVALRTTTSSRLTLSSRRHWPSRAAAVSSDRFSG